MYAPVLIELAALGASVAERHSFLNGCIHVWVIKNDCPDSSNPYKWTLYIATCEHFPGGYSQGGFNTRKEAVAMANGRYPSHGLTYSHGDTWVEVRLHSAKVREILRLDRMKPENMPKNPLNTDHYKECE